jgi:putative addiction module CopG family antidote
MPLLAAAMIDTRNLEAHVWRMNVTIGPAAEEIVKRKLASGIFASAEEVIVEGLRALDEREGRWRTEIDIGWEEAKAGKFRSPEDVRAGLAGMKARLKQAVNE